MDKKLLFVFNPTSGKAQIKNWLFRIIDAFSKEGWLVTTYPTQKSGDACELTKEYAPIDRYLEDQVFFNTYGTKWDK